MRRAISDCNSTLDLAISPSTWLLPSNMVILKEIMPGYNNTLLRASERGMKFGINSGLNYHKPTVVPKKAHQDGGSDLGEQPKKVNQAVVTWTVSFARPLKQVAEHTNVSNGSPAKPVEKEPVLVPDSHTSELMILGVLGAGVGVLVSKYVL